MPRQSIINLFEGIEARLPAEAAELYTDHLHYDSRRIGRGGLFIAVRGFKVDGHKYLKDVQNKGALAAVVEEPSADIALPQIIVTDSRKAMAALAGNFYKQEIESLDLIGITGTNGKTTTSFLVRSILDEAGLPGGTIGTIAYYLGDKKVDAWNTTPEALDICEMLNQLAGIKQKNCVLEVSSHALSLSRVDGLRFKAAIFTNLSRDHLDFHKTEEEYFEAKAHLFSLLESDGTAVINGDDPWGLKLIDKLSGDIITFGFDSSTDLRATSWQMDIKGMRFKIENGTGVLPISTKLISEFNVQNILAAVGIGIALGIPKDIIKRGIEKVEYIPGRLEVHEILPGIVAVIDYAHTPDALSKALQAVRKITERRLIVVFGAGGNRDKGKRPQMGRIASDLADTVIVTSDNPRAEDPGEIIQDIVTSMPDNENRVVIIEREKAIAHAVSIAREGDVILIAGKGHETYQDINGVKHDFDDRVVVKKAAANVGN